MQRIVLVLLCAVAPVLAAQNPPDTSQEAQTQHLRQQIRQRWQQVVRTQLDLTPDQATKLQATEDRFAAQRRGIVQRQRGVQEALRGQLQPGVAANADSVRRLMDARELNRATLAQIDRDEDREIAGYLSPGASGTSSCGAPGEAVPECEGGLDPKLLPALRCPLPPEYVT